ncbi:MAG: exo-alpha-sialidase [Nitrospinae bacterium]|nr:exo-alpha-sialidase [Nitrospinota bacterium]
MKALLLAVAVLLAATPALADPFIAEDLVFPAQGFGRPHGASMVELTDGSIFATWFSSKVETSGDARIFGAQWSPATGAWSLPRTIVDDRYSKSLGNTALFRDDDGRIWLWFAAVFAGGWSGAMVDYTVSADDGQTWSPGKRLVWWPGNLPRNPPIDAGDHTMLVPLFIDFWYEADLSGSYTARIDYRNGQVVGRTYASMDDPDAIQPTLVPLPDGRILALMRDKGEVAVKRSWSADGGRSWGQVSKTNLPNPGSAIAALYVEEIGATLLVYNHSSNTRDPLSLAVSRDGGATFTRIADLAQKGGDPEASFDYPAILRTKDGLIHAIWTHDKRATLKHVRFNVEWLRRQLRKAGLPVRPE